MVSRGGRPPRPASRQGDDMGRYFQISPGPDFDELPPPLPELPGAASRVERGEEERARAALREVRGTVNGVTCGVAEDETLLTLAWARAQAQGRDVGKSCRRDEASVARGRGDALAARHGRDGRARGRDTLLAGRRWSGYGQWVGARAGIRTEHQTSPNPGNEKRRRPPQLGRPWVAERRDIFDGRRVFSRTY